jgi:hypothetical protein
MMAQTHSPFLDSLWRRIALVVFCACWSLFELIWGDSFWATLAIGMTAYGTWLFLINYKTSADRAADTKPEKE